MAKFTFPRRNESNKALNDRFEALSKVFVQKRQKAIDGRRNCGIENNWIEDIEFYENGDLKKGKREPVDKSDPLSIEAEVEKHLDEMARSSLAINMTRTHTDNASARLADIVTKNDELPWRIEPTPVQDELEIIQGNIPQEYLSEIQRKMQYDGRLAQMPQEQIDESIANAEQQFVDQAELAQKEAMQKARLAEKRIKDWQLEGKFIAQLRKVMKDAAKLGTGIMKGPFPMPCRKAAYIDGQYKVIEDVKPLSARVDPWNCFPDPACGDNIHNGEFHFERDYKSRSQLKALAKRNTFFPEQIKKVLKEGPKRQGATGESEKSQALGLSTPNQSTERFALWICYAVIEKQDLNNIGGEIVFDESDAQDLNEYHVICHLVNDHIIGLTLNPLNSGELPYDYFAWSQRSGMPWGEGLPSIMQDTQRMANGGVRALMDNAGRASAPQLVINRSAIEPAGGGQPVIRPHQVWLFNEDSSFDSTAINDAFQVVDIPIHQQELAGIIMLARDLSEMVSGTPWLVMGQQAGATNAQQQTAGAARTMSENASGLVRELGSNFDDYLIEPHVRRYYQYFLEYGPDDGEKGDMNVVAKGAIALLEKDLHAQLRTQIIELPRDPTSGSDPKKFMEFYLEVLGLPKEKLMYDDPAWQQVVEQLAQPQTDPRVDVAQIQSETERLKIASNEVIELRKNLETLFVEEWRRKNAIDIAQIDGYAKQVDQDIAAFKAESDREKAAKDLFQRASELQQKLSADLRIRREEMSSKEIIESMKVDQQNRNRAEA